MHLAPKGFAEGQHYWEVIIDAMWDPEGSDGSIRLGVATSQQIDSALLGGERRRGVDLPAKVEVLREHHHRQRLPVLGRLGRDDAVELQQVLVHRLRDACERLDLLGELTAVGHPGPERLDRDRYLTGQRALVHLALDRGGEPGYK